MHMKAPCPRRQLSTSIQITLFLKDDNLEFKEVLKINKIYFGTGFKNIPENLQNNLLEIQTTKIHRIVLTIHRTIYTKYGQRKLITSQKINRPTFRGMIKLLSKRAPEYINEIERLSSVNQNTYR